MDAKRVTPLGSEGALSAILGDDMLLAKTWA